MDFEDGEFTEVEIEGVKGYAKTFFDDRLHIIFAEPDTGVASELTITYCSSNDYALPLLAAGLTFWLGDVWEQYTNSEALKNQLNNNLMQLKKQIDMENHHN